MRRDKVLEARKKWIARLLNPDSKKAKTALTRVLPSGEKCSCCLGHAVEALKDKDCEIETLPLNPKAGVGFRLVYDGYGSFLPTRFELMLGLYDEEGIFSDNKCHYQEFKKMFPNLEIQGATDSFNTLALINDKTNITPQMMGKYLESVIEGGPGTPFFALTDYKK
jgi:hypothetical protein